jgi:hypothetical protein
VATYNRQYCEDFVKLVLQNSTEDMLVEYWLLFSGLRDMRLYTIDGIIIQWHNMAIWNKQCVLFLFIPIIDNIVSKRAKLFADIARIKDPL